MTKDFWTLHLESCLRLQSLPGLEKHPVVNRLMNLYVERLKAYCAIPLFVRECNAGGPKPLELLSELQELGGWVFRKKFLPWTDKDENEVANIFIDRAYSFEEAKEGVRQARALNATIRAHPRREMAIRAKEMKDADSSLTWADVTERVCDCQHQHTESCTDQLKSAVSELNNLLKKYQEKKP